MPRVEKPRSAPPVLRAILTISLLMPALFLTVPPVAGAERPPARSRTPGASLPDSILAVVRSDRPDEPGREIGRARFARAWSRLAPPARPDSLTPAGARRFLDLLIDKEALGLMASRERWTWTARESTAFEALRDRLVVEAVLDSALAATRRALGPSADSLDAQALGVAARDRAVEWLHPVFDDALLARLALAFAALRRPTADSSLSAQLRMLGASPEVAPADTGRVVARTPAGDYRVSDLLASWRRLNPIYRPRIRSSAEVRDLVTNGVFERLLRREGAARDVERRPDVVERLASQRELNDVTHLVEREVYERIATDSLTLLRFYRSTERDWMLPTRVRLMRVVLGSRSEATTMALRLGNEAAAESLAAGARRAGTQWLVDVSAEEDSALFARALRAGNGAVMGPDVSADGWPVARVMAVLPGRGRPFDEARDLVARRWYGEEGERLMRALASRARAGLRIEVNDAALEALVRQPPESPGPAGRSLTRP